MITLNRNAKITSYNTELKIDLKNIVPEGEYEVVIILQEIEKQQQLPFIVSDVAVDSYQNFKIEDMYN